MRAVVQRVTSARVEVDGKTVGEIGPGLLVLVAAHRNDTEANAKKLADRIANLRIFNDADGKMNLPIPPPTAPNEKGAIDATGDRHSEPVEARTIADPDHSPRITHHSILAVSNFTVLGDTTQRRPSFVAAAPYEQGEELFNAFVAALRSQGIETRTGVFGADMKVALTNDGPVTVIVEA